MRWLVLVILCLVLGGCGNPNVPLTQPPADAFRVATPRPTPTPVPLRLGSVTARFFNLPWLDRPSLLQVSAEFFGIPLVPKMSNNKGNS
ncbi:MAG: hypothetical protein Q6L58_02590 [Thermostichales cyanobacterium BF3_bins_165]